MRNTWTHLMVSDQFYLVVGDTFNCPLDVKLYCPLTFLSPSHHNFFVRHINISSGANHTFEASLPYFLPPFGCRQLPARTLHFNQPLLRTVHYFCYFICGSITSTTSPDISLFSATSIDVTQLPTLHLWFQKRGGASNITVYCSNKK